MDTSTSEYLFCIDFFQEDSIYHELIAPTLSVIEAALAAQLQVSFRSIVRCWSISPVTRFAELPFLPSAQFGISTAALALGQSPSHLIFHQSHLEMVSEQRLENKALGRTVGSSADSQNFLVLKF